MIYKKVYKKVKYIRIKGKNGVNRKWAFGEALVISSL